jgi:hypothetical protein
MVFPFKSIVIPLPDTISPSLKQLRLVSSVKSVSIVIEHGDIWLIESSPLLSFSIVCG